jgi:hypothetical protein
MIQRFNPSSRKICNPLKKHWPYDLFRIANPNGRLDGWFCALHIELRKEFPVNNPRIYPGEGVHRQRLRRFAQNHPA